MVAAVARDQDACVLWVVSERVNSSSPLLGEALAAVLAIKTAVSFNSGYVSFEGDSSSLVAAIQSSPSSPNWEITNAVSDFMYLSSSLLVWSVSKIPKTANFMAHNIACWAFFVGTEGMVPLALIPQAVLSDSLFLAVSPLFVFLSIIK